MSDSKDQAVLSTEQKMNLETARIGWDALQRFFAKGVVVIVEPGTDLVKTAALCVDNDSGGIQEMIDRGAMRGAEIEDARRWNDDQAELWAVVVAPWVLVQED